MHPLQSASSLVNKATEIIMAPKFVEDGIKFPSYDACKKFHGFIDTNSTGDKKSKINKTDDKLTTL